jgi:hypothetical protein
MDVPIMAKSCPMCDSTNLVKGDYPANGYDAFFKWKGKKIPERSARDAFRGQRKRYTTDFPPSGAVISAVGCKSCGHISLVASELTTYDSRVETWEDSPIVKEKRAEEAEADLEYEHQQKLRQEEENKINSIRKKRDAKKKESEIAKLKDRIKKLEKE